MSLVLYSLLIFLKQELTCLRLFLAFPETDRVEHLAILTIYPVTATERQITRMKASFFTIKKSCGSISVE